MIDDLGRTLQSILDDPGAPKLVRDANVSFQRPEESYKPSASTINLFLYDLRENVELRDNEPIIDRQNGVATIRNPPIRVACSYLVTAWIESGATGETALLRQHQLLGGVLGVFASVPSIPSRYLQGGLKTQLYPIPLAVAKGDLVRNPAEFWSALGGRLRPSITVTATIAMDQSAGMVTAPEVSSKQMVLEQIDGGGAQALVEIGGTVRDSQTHAPLEATELMLVELGLRTQSDLDGRFTFSGVVAGSYSVRAVKQGFSTVTRSVQVPGISPTSFDIDLSPSA
jgi:hypothetical protein